MGHEEGVYHNKASFQHVSEFLIFFIFMGKQAQSLNGFTIVFNFLLAF